jgi:hypothetical protein
MDLLLFEVIVCDSHLDLPAGTRLAVDLRRARMWSCDRILQPNYGYLAGMLAEGRLRWITSQSVLEASPPPAFPVRVVA